LYFAIYMRRLNRWFVGLILIVGAAPAIAESYPDSLLQQARRDFLISNYNAALASFTSLASYAEEISNDTFYMAALAGIGDCHYYLRDKHTALQWYHTGKTIAQNRIEPEHEAVFDYKISVMFIEMGTVDSAELYASRAIRQFRRTNDYAQLSKALSALADLHLNTTHDYQKAETLIEEALSYAQKTDNPEMIGFALMKYSFLNYNRRNHAKALAYAEQAESYYKKTGKLEDVLYAIMQKSFCQIMLKDTAAIQSISVWFDFKDSIFQKEKASSIARVQALYETERKERENQILLQEAQINELKLKTRNRTIFVLLALLAGVGMFGAWRLYAGRLKRKQQELLMLENLQKDKERIARDLHDHVGGQLSFLVHSIDGITQQPEEKREAIKASIMQSLRSVISGVRETIWAINDKHITVTDFMDKLKVFTANMLQYSDIKYHFSEAIQEDRELGPLLALNIYRICQEIIQNTFKHAQASNLYIHCDADTNKITVEIKDDGTGFDPCNQKDDNRGIENIKARAAEFNIRVQLHTALNQGTSYTIIV
jgi:signal transduction histidine kinase